MGLTDKMKVINLNLFCKYKRKLFVCGVIIFLIYIYSKITIYPTFDNQDCLIQNVRFNIYSNSLSYGLYIRSRKNSKKRLKEGQIISCQLRKEIEEEGFKKGYLIKNIKRQRMPVIKKIIAIEGQRVLIQNSTVMIDGEKIDYVVQKYDRKGREIKLFYDKKQWILEEGEYWVMSDNKKWGWDSRYWGPVRKECVYEPWIVWGKKE